MFPSKVSSTLKTTLYFDMYINPTNYTSKVYLAELVSPRITDTNGPWIGCNDFKGFSPQRHKCVRN